MQRQPAVVTFRKDRSSEWRDEGRRRLLVRAAIVAACTVVLAACLYVLYLQLDPGRNETLREMPVVGRYLAVPVVETIVAPAPASQPPIPAVPFKWTELPGMMPGGRLARAGNEIEAMRVLAALLPLGVRLVQSEESEKGYQILKKGLEAVGAFSEDPLVREAKFWLGIAALDSDRKEEGERILEDLAQVAGHVRAMNELVIHYYNGDQYDKARAMLDRLEDSRVKGKTLHTIRTRIQLERKIVKGFASFESRHCRIRYAPALHEDEARKASEQCEAAYRLVARRLAIPLAKWKLVVVLVSDDAYRSLRRGEPSWSSGFFSWKAYIPERSMMRTRLFEETVRHETAHAILGLAEIRCPSWLNEGLAEYVEHRGIRWENLALYEREVGLGRKPTRPLSRFPGRFAEEEDPARAADLYLQAASIVFHMMEYKGEAFLRNVLLRLKFSHQPGKDVAEALGESPDKLYSGWLRTLRDRAKEERR